jgi:pyruvate dehydrogenase E1 component alpha subunit
MGTYAPARGQEAHVGIGFAMKKEDWFLPSFREQGVLFTLGLLPENHYLAWNGDERGQKFPEGLNTFPISIPVGTHIPHAAGVAWALKLQKKKAAAIGVTGDGGTSKGDFAEALNLAGVLQLPLVAITQNNQWAISMPRSRQTAAQTLAQKAIAAGIPGMQVDGNDCVAVYKAVSEALEKARNGGGPTLLELFTYRMSDHTTADDAARYRNPSELETWKKRDPIERVKKFFVKKKAWSDGFEKKTTEDARKRVDAAVAKMESYPAPKPDELFDYVFDKTNPNLEEQRKELLAGLEEE